MSCYISSNENRFYTAVELSYGRVPTVGEANRIPAVQLVTKQQTEKVERRDKTGGRTFLGTPQGLRKRTQFQLNTYMTGWSTPGQEPSYGPMFRAALGGDPMFFGGGTVQSASNASTIQLSAAHGLTPGQAVTVNGELRFVAAIVDAQTVVLCAPLSATPAGGTAVGPTVTYAPATMLQSASIFDYWSPETAVHRILNGAAVDRMKIKINGDFHEFEFRGEARDLIDSSSFSAGQGELTAFPAEPAMTELDYTIIPGHLGQAWLGAIPEHFLTVTEAEFSLENNLDLRSREFGSAYASCVSAGRRKVTADFTLFGREDAGTKGLYQAARQESPISVMFQLGQQSGQLAGVYLKGVVPEVPEYEDSETRLQWRFSGARAQGIYNDEMYVAFG